MKEAGLPPYEAGTMVWLQPQNIKPTPWNPKSRTDSKAKHMQRLIEAIKKTGGVGIPLAITEDGSLVEGNRRRAAAIFIALMENKVILVPCIVLDTSVITPEKWYSILNSTQRSVRGKEPVELYYNNYKALTDTQYQKMNRIKVRAGGSRNLKALKDLGFSLSVDSEVNGLLERLGKEANALSYFTIAKWILVNRLTNRVRHIRNSSIPTKDIVQKIKAEQGITREELRAGRVN